MAQDKEIRTKVSLLDIQRGLLLPLLVGGGGLGLYGSNVLASRLDNEIESRKAMTVEMRELRQEINQLQRDMARLEERLGRSRRADRF